MSIRATTTKYIIRAKDLNKITSGGIIVNSTDETQLAEIIAIGPQVIDPVPLGALIVIDWRNAVPFKHENEQFYVIDYRAVSAVVEDYNYES
jgi:co-chaperonin GroES (HSP10)